MLELILPAHNWEKVEGYQGTTRRSGSANHPASQGRVGRANGTLKRTIGKQCEQEGNDLD